MYIYIYDDYTHYQGQTRYITVVVGFINCKSTWYCLATSSFQCVRFSREHLSSVIVQICMEKKASDAYHKRVYNYTIVCHRHKSKAKFV